MYNRALSSSEIQQLYNEGTPSTSSTISLPKTGQTTSYEAGDDGANQAGVNWPSPRFTDNGDGTIMDNLTGLMWLKDADCFGTQTWSQSLTTATGSISGCSGYTASYSDWRLPNVNELLSLLDYSQYNPILPSNHPFFNVKTDTDYWSSTSFPCCTQKQGVNINDGGTTAPYESTNFYVWPVRLGQTGSADSNYPANVWKTGQTTSYASSDDGALQRGVSWPSPRFTISGDCVIDNLTGLTWTKDANLGGTKTWSNAISYSNGLTLCGHNDWRLPNVGELFSLIDYSKRWPNLPSGHPFVNLVPMTVGGYWASTTCASDTAKARNVGINHDGGSRGGGCLDKAAYSKGVWSVRGGINQNGGGSPDISASPTSNDLGSVTVGSSSSATTFTISNNGTADLTINSISISGTNSSEFSTQNDSCSNQTISASSDCTVDVIFSPTTAGSKSATLQIPSNDADTPILSVSLSGTGVAIQYTLTISKTGSGSGTVTSAPSGINCGSDCSKSYSAGTLVTLTAAPDTGSTFTGWSGGGCSSTATTCSITLNSNTSITANFTINPSTSQVPVLIVPGFMGSFSSCLFDPVCGTYDLKLCGASIQLTSKWVLDPIKCNFIKGRTYEQIVNDFISLGGYVKDKTLFEVPYDWRGDNLTTAINTLKAKINNAIAISGHSHVDIVAHSMGGLLVRSYIEYWGESNIRKFVMLGTPNHGSARAYYLWEGADFSTYPRIARVLISKMFQDMKIGNGYGSESDIKFIHDMIPSIQQLLPDHDYIITSGSSESMIAVNSMVFQNNLLSELNHNTLISTLGLKNIKIYAGTHKRTLEKIDVYPISGIDEWFDGEPVEKPPKSEWQFGSGDNTVLLNSAELADITVEQMKNVEHSNLPKKASRKVIEFVSGKALKTEIKKSRTKPERVNYERENSLFFRSSNDILMGITSGRGNRVGHFPNIKGKVLEVEDYSYLGNKKKTISIGIYNVQRGRYSLSVTTTDIETEYDIFISFKDIKNNKERRKQLRGKLLKGEERIHVVEVNSNDLIVK